MRSIQVVNVRWFNATAWYGMYLSRLLLEAGHDTLVLTLPDSLSAQQGKAWGLPMRSLPLNTHWGALSLYAQLRRLVREFRPDVVNCHRGESFFLWGLLKKELTSKLASKLTGRPTPPKDGVQGASPLAARGILASPSFKLVRTRGDQRLPKASAVNRWLHNTVCDAVITTNARMTDHFRDVFHTPHQKLHQILGGVDTKVFFPDLTARNRIRTELGYTDSDFVLGLLGRFDQVKGQHELIQAVAKLHGQGFPVRLLLLGFDSATPESTVRAWISEYGLEQVVRITGKRPDIAACINALDLGVIASLWSETIARAALEIMACGVPLVSTNVGVMPDLLDPEALCRPGDVDALAAHIRTALTRPDFLAALSQSQSRRMAGLSGQNFLTQTLQVYQSL